MRATAPELTARMVDAVLAGDGLDAVGHLAHLPGPRRQHDAAAAAIPRIATPSPNRLERLRELTGLHPARADDRERLGLGIKAQLVLDALAQVR